MGSHGVVGGVDFTESSAESPLDLAEISMVALVFGGAKHANIAKYGRAYLEYTPGTVHDVSQVILCRSDKK